MDKPSSALREPMVWLMLSLPFAALVAGAITFYIAVTH